jgi:hypothetical protein
MIFKKQISLLIAFLVLVSNSGLAFNIHYCEGKMASISSVFSKEEVCNMPVDVTENCCAKVKTTHKKCCSDKEVNLKDTTDKDSVKIIFSTPIFFINQELPLNILAQSTTVQSTENVAYNCCANAPPLYQLYCQYTFYA